MGMTFVTNHYGMSFDVPKEDGFLARQVATTRNIGSSFRPLNAFLHFMYGGLNYQIEHHLWPYMSRPNLCHAEAIVRSHCKKAGITHHTVTPFRAYKEVFENFANIGAHLRACDRKNVRYV